MPSFLSRAWLLSIALVTAAASHPIPAAAQTSRGALTPGSWAITNVSVLPMTSDTVMAGATVLVRDGRIAAMGPARQVTIPAGTRTIDGRGKFLIPGLADMHTHLFSDDVVPDSVAPYELGVMLANGITATRLMIGTPEHLVLRRDVMAGRIAGPQLWVASPQFAGRAYPNGRHLTTAEGARAAVNEVTDAGYDFIKLTLWITPELYDAISAEARHRRIPVVGHVERVVGVTRALATGQSIEHLDSYIEAVVADSARQYIPMTERSIFQARYWDRMDYIDPVKVAWIAGETARSGTWTIPTLAVFNRSFALGQSEAEFQARPEWPMFPPGFRATYLRAYGSYWPNAASEARRHRWAATRNQLVKAIADSGGKILAGSDTPEWFFGYGFTLHRELESLVAAGLTPYQALVAATRGPAEFLGAIAEWGTITPGKRADLVLLDANPLERIGNTSRITGVAIGGRYLDRAALDTMLREATTRISAPTAGN